MDKIKNMIRFVVIADTHCSENEIEIPDGDVFIHAGDFTGLGKEYEILVFNQWLSTLPHPIKIIIAGNHDFLFQENTNFAKSLLTNAIYLQDEEYILKDGKRNLKIYGSPWTLKFYNWAFMLQENELKEKWTLIPHDTDILITHSPPYGILDKIRYGYSAGCPSLLEKIKLCNIKYHIFGHIHENNGIKMIQNCSTKFINASVVNDFNKPIVKPLIFEF